MYYIIDNEPFPEKLERDQYGYVAIGGDLSPQRLIEAYKRGIFPWYPFKLTEVMWCCPETRFVIFPSEVHVSHSMHTLINSHRYAVTFNQSFNEVIDWCGKVDKRDKHDYAWLGSLIKKAYGQLAELGYASSVEVWDLEGKLVGGLYGVTINKCFIGESMFSLVPSASKLALIGLARKLESEGWKFIDCQMPTDHLRSMGGQEISYEKYMELISAN